MIFKSLNLNNFRVFNGCHNIDLQPRKDGLLAQPIILFGGLNGAGKTSILTAIRLILLGRKALGSSVTSAEYKQYLTQQINNKAAKENSSTFASINLEFSHTHQGQHSTYSVERQWNADGIDKLKIAQDNELITGLNTDQVQSLLSEMIPPGIGDLFFFDGEKIAELAEDDTGLYLKEAVQKLLGIDVINRLGSDLDIYIKQISKDKADRTTLQQIESLEQEKTEFELKAIKSRELADQVWAQLGGTRKLISLAESKIQDRGGAWAKTKSDEKAKAEAFIKEKALLETNLSNELDGTFPISLAPKAVSSLIEQLEKDKAQKESNVFLEKLNSLSSALISDLAESLATSEGQVCSALTNSIEKLKKGQSKAEVKIDVSDSDYYGIKALVSSSKESSAKLTKLTRDYQEVSSELESISLNILRAPDEDELATLYEKLRILDKEEIELKANYIEHLTIAKSNMTKALELAKRLEKLFNHQKNEASLFKAISRVDATQNVLTEFSNELIQLRVSQLEELFAKAYRKLARKEDLKLSAQINPETFDVTLMDHEGVAINRKSLSAGEKQIFAFAILEALGKLSGKVLPVVVDTPLGRLDSKHRDKLIKHYFPDAGEQVILLSTDTEVDEDFYELLSQHVSHSFEISFDENSRCSSVSEGYFWAARNKEAM